MHAIFYQNSSISANAVMWSLELTEGTLHLHTTTCHNCLHFCVILLFPLQISSFESHWIVRAVCPFTGKWNSKQLSKQNMLTGGSSLPNFSPLTWGQNAIHFTGMPIFPALLKRSSISNNVFIVWLWSLFTFCSGNSTFNAWSHFMIHNFLVFVFLHWLVKIQCNLSVVKMYPCCTGIMCCSQHVCSLDAAFVLFNPIWSMVGLAFSLCCLFLLHGFILFITNKTRKKTQNYTYTNIFQ